MRLCARIFLILACMAKHKNIPRAVSVGWLLTDAVASEIPTTCVYPLKQFAEVL